MSRSGLRLLSDASSFRVCWLIQPADKKRLFCSVFLLGFLCVWLGIFSQIRFCLLMSPIRCHRICPDHSRVHISTSRQVAFVCQEEAPEGRMPEKEKWNQAGCLQPGAAWQDVYRVYRDDRKEKISLQLRQCTKWLTVRDELWGKPKWWKGFSLFRPQLKEESRTWERLRFLASRKFN